MYICLLLLDEKHICIKIGYTADMTDRLKTLTSEYKCQVYLCGIGFIKNEQCEKGFHTILKQKYPELCFELNINGTNKDEVYYCSHAIVNEFFSFIETKANSLNDDKSLLFAQETTKQVEAECNARKAESEVKRLELEFAIMKFQADQKCAS